MAEFRFRLQTVLQLRRLREEQAQMQLELARSEVSRREAHLQGTLQADVDARLASRGECTGQTMDPYLEWIAREQRKAALAVNEAQRQAELARQSVRVAVRNTRLIEKLEAADRERWRLAEDRKVAQQAAESHLARWANRRTPP